MKLNSRRSAPVLTVCKGNEESPPPRHAILAGSKSLLYGRLAGRLDDTTRLLRELEERASGGEYVPAFSPLSIHVGLGDVQAIRTLFRTARAKATPPTSLRATNGQVMEQLRSDPKIHRMLFELYGW